VAVTANGTPVLSGALTMPIVGTWHANLDLDAPVAPTGRISIDWDGVPFSGTVVRSGADEGGRSQALIVGGAGGFSKVLTGKYYASGPTLKIIVADILSEAGETLSSTADASVLSHVVARWERTAGTAGYSLTAALDDAGATWRVLSDGTVWVGKDTFPAVARADIPGLTVLDENHSSGFIVVSVDAPLLRPGVTLLERQAREVTFTLTPGSSRAEIRYQSLGDVLGRILERATRKAEYSGSFPGKVVAYSSGQADLVPDDERVRGIGGLSRVPVRVGLPGITLDYVAGSRRAAATFEAADPKRPSVTSWEQGGKLKLGSIVFVQASVTPFAIAPPIFFPAGIVGDLAAQAAFTAGNIPGVSIAWLLPLEITKVVATD
jgi:hypothetical protein